MRFFLCGLLLGAAVAAAAEPPSDLKFIDPHDIDQDKLLWATDEGWWSFGNRDKQMKLHDTFLEELDLPAEARYKIYRGNAEKLFGFKPAATGHPSSGNSQ